LRAKKGENAMPCFVLGFEANSLPHLYAKIKEKGLNLTN
jgi:hypothetical protein